MKPTIETDIKTEEEAVREFTKEFVNDHTPDNVRFLRGIFMDDVYDFIRQVFRAGVESEQKRIVKLANELKELQVVPIKDAEVRSYVVPLTLLVQEILLGYKGDEYKITPAIPGKCQKPTNPGVDSYDFYSAWDYIQDQCDIRNTYVMSCLDIHVAKINPKTGSIDDNDELNTQVEIWLEFGFPEKDAMFREAAVHDTDLDCGADTFEEGIIKLAELIKNKYGHEKEN